MERIIYTTIYDELLHRIETIGISEIDKSTLSVYLLKAKTVMEDRKGGRLIITLSNFGGMKRDLELLNRSLKKEEEIQFFLYTLKRRLVFNAQDIFIYRILCSHWINNQVDGIATITLDKIHKTYRSKAFKYEKGKDKYDEETLNAYYRVFVKLIGINIALDFRQSHLQIANYYRFNDIEKINGNMLEIVGEIDKSTISKASIKYNLGVLGKYFLNTRQCGQLLPKEIYSLRFNQIDTFNMSIYISRMIIMNNKRKSDTRIVVSTMLLKIMKYDKSGTNRLITYSQYIAALDAVKRNKIIKNIEAQILYILELLKTKECISEYTIQGKFNYKYIKDGELSIVILKGKNSKGK